MNDPTNAWITAAAVGLINCHSCGQLHKATQAHVYCHRCGASLHLRKPDSLSRTWAYLLAAYVLYIPANVLPIMTTTQLGSIQSNTILSGVNYLLVTGSWLVALIIFIASVFCTCTEVDYSQLSGDFRSSPLFAAPPGTSMALSSGGNHGALVHG